MSKVFSVQDTVLEDVLIKVNEGVQRGCSLVCVYGKGSIHIAILQEPEVKSGPTDNKGGSTRRKTPTATKSTKPVRAVRSKPRAKDSSGGKGKEAVPGVS